jgi:hypothetical protein
MPLGNQLPSSHSIQAKVTREKEKEGKWSRVEGGRIMKREEKERQAKNIRFLPILFAIHCLSCK